MSLVAPALQVDSLALSHQGSFMLYILGLLLILSNEFSCVSEKQPCLFMCQSGDLTANKFSMYADFSEACM